MSSQAGSPALEVAQNLDLDRYQGLWYEVARLPAAFERECARDVIAEYKLRRDGRITVINRCRKADGELKQTKGTAKIAEKAGPCSKLKVTFFWPFFGDYWILDVDPDYQWSLVGTPNRKNLWILSRTPQIRPSLYRALLQSAKVKGFDVDRIALTRQADAERGILASTRMLS